MKLEPDTIALGFAALPAALVGLFERCSRAGLYGDADREVLVEMYRLDPGATFDLVADMAKRVLRCRGCIHFRQPGASDGYCVGREDLLHAYGLLHCIPADGGAWCPKFRPTEALPSSRCVGASASTFGSY